MTPKPLSLALVISFLGCAQQPASAQNVSTQNVAAAGRTLAVATPAATATMQHYEIRPEDLPAPFATADSSSSPALVAQTQAIPFQLPAGFQATLWASALGSPRWMTVAPNGDVFVADQGAGRVIVLADTNGGGVANVRSTFASNLHEPFGIAFNGQSVYIGDTDAILRFPYVNGQRTASGSGQQIAALPSGGHSTRNLLFNGDGSKLYVAIGSSSNVQVENDERRAAIIEMSPDGSNQRVFASGLRNPVGLAWNPANRSLWTVVNERDDLGDNLVPDYATEVRDSGFYGWPYSYIGQHLDPRMSSVMRDDLVAKAIVPSVLFQSHSAPLGLTFYNGSMFPPEYHGDAFVAFHGSWNRSEPTGYKVVRVHFQGGQPQGGYDDFMTGFLSDPTKKTIIGRPVGLAVLPDGSLLVGDDTAGKIWRVTWQGPGDKRRAARH
jgi:glucose/arabinose dehydrogenase